MHWKPKNNQRIKKIKGQNFIQMRRLFAIAGSILVLSLGCHHSDNKSNEKNEFSSPIDSLTAIIENGGKDANLFYQRGKFYFQDRKLDDAINDLNVAVKIDSTKPEYFIDLSQYYLLDSHSEKTRDILKRAEKNFPDNIPVLTELGKLYLYVSDYEKSKAYFNHILELDNYNGMAYYYKGIIAKEENRPKTLRKFMQKTIQYLPDFYEGYFAMGLSYVNDTDSLAVQYLNTAIRLKPNSIEAYYAKGMYFQNSGNPLQAVRQYEFILDSLDSNYSDAYYNIGYLLLAETNKYQESEPYFEKVLKLDSSRLDALYNIGLAKEMQKNFPAARKYYSMVLKKDANFDLAIKGMNRLDKKSLSKKY